MRPIQLADDDDPIEQVDANGDSIFRFSIGVGDHAGRVRPRGPQALEAFYRNQLKDLLQVVRLYAGERHVIIDGFAFADRPDHVLPLVEPTLPDV